MMSARKVASTEDSHGAAVLCGPLGRLPFILEMPPQRCLCIILCDRCHQVPFRKVAEATDIHGMHSAYQAASKWQGQAVNPGVQFGDSTAVQAATGD